uniref:Cathepsin propeptide inhibitor domain-containing protein n=1 Tax=Oryza punctata TaxID=4537 RepID=A0A0E0JS97_ORYPU
MSLKIQATKDSVPSGELELKLLRPGNTMEVSMATALDGKQPYTTNTAGEPPAFKYLTGEEATMKTSDGDERMEGSKKLTEDEEQALKVRFQEWMNKFNRNYKDEAEKAYRFEIFK